ncbi:MAG TPA: hypothetical protein VF170_01055 [Planctomycetaceae bacterium]
MPVEVRVCSVYVRPDRFPAEFAGEVGPNEAVHREPPESREYRDARRAALRHAVEERRVTSLPTSVIGESVLPGLQRRRTPVKAVGAAAGGG